ncbi:Multidrug export protein EmrA [Acinetobacter oleivorans]|uniref:HlyD family secretion protein n=1 Tax=Acinetobacter oleivorans TaxID=1148157 RepID=UPI0017865B06|nr:HlyD family secretion protein [Acinetobacter oleivorans]CAI3119588.1 Multidrug export protein EmrA [Acinetobacter oleivorans]CAI3119593.1 Multidrug export protein EmrA [Acinetobacter oleivorans]CAI3119686.1 Multidrug export protein EmrA [Acinetobacter oleivorans]CAI3120071.1 Multidrug export protein EmrA [Acinetobacter oleivorans]CAI3120078.1 Multidrug export protein EmrA [Acinetobacter oleivorans]
MALILALIVTSIILYFFYISGSDDNQYIDNAYVSGKVVPVVTNKSGVLKDVLIKRGDKVQRGDILFKFDHTVDQLNVDIQKEALRAAIRQSSSACLGLDISLKATQNSKAQSEFSSDQMHRYRTVGAGSVISKDAFEKVGMQAKLDKLAQESSELEYYKSKFLANNEAMDDISVIDALAKLKRAVYELSLDEIRAPISGYIYEVYGYAGMAKYTDSSATTLSNPLTIIVPEDDIFIEANILETQLKNIRIGQEAKIYSDIYGKEVVLDGYVYSIVPAAASVFSPLPRNNVDSNWIKVNQRVPILIRFEQNIDNMLPLGTSVRVEIQTSTKELRKNQYLLEQRQVKSSQVGVHWENEYNEIVNKILNDEGLRLKQFDRNTKCTINRKSILLK